MNLYEKIKLLCNEKDITVKYLEQSLQISENTISKWAKSMPAADKLDKVAEYFDISVQYLLDKAENRGKYEMNFKDNQLTDTEEKDLAKTMRKIKDQLINEQGLMFDGEILDGETARLLLEAIEQQERTIKVINRKYTPKKFRQ